MNPVVSAALLAALLGASLPAAAQPKQAPQPADLRLEVSLQTNQRVCQVEEPLVVVVKLTNRGSSALRVPDGLDNFGKGAIDLDIRDAQGQRVGYDPFASPGFMAYSEDYQGQEIPVDGSLTVWLDLRLQGPSTPVWTQPGTYTLRARYHWAHPQVRAVPHLTAGSQPVTVRVVEASGRDLAAYTLFRQAPPPRERNAHEVKTHYRRVMARYPGSRWARYAHLRLAEWLDLDCIGVRDARPEHFDAAIEE